MKKIFIVGGNGFARECYVALQNMHGYNTEFSFQGFYGHGGYGRKEHFLEWQHLYLGDISEYELSKDEYVVIGVAQVDIRKKIYTELKERKANFFTIGPKNVIDNPHIVLGEANFFVDPTYLSCHISIGNGNVFNGNVGIGHDVAIGNFNFIAPNVYILGNVRINDSNQIGASSVLLPNAKIGSNNKIAPLSAVYKGCKDNSYMLGNPALKVGTTD